MTGDLRAVRVADVYKAGVPAATLSRGPESVTFAYLPDYAGPQVARTLPMGEPVVTYGGAVPAFFAGLLPEGRRLNAVRRAAKTSPDDDLTLLLMVGSDTVGDVTVFPEGADPVAQPAAVATEDISQLRFADLLADSGFVDRRGLPGIQEKLSAGMITLPASVAGSEVIIKLDPPDFPDAVENESYFLSVARRLRLPVVESEVVHDRDGRPGLVVRRFDRQGSTRLAVEDATQLLDLYPASKYALTSEQAAEAVADVCAARAVAVANALQQFVLAWLTGNGDLHGKNIAVVQHNTGEWRVAPLFDLPSTLVYGDLSMALSLQGAVEGLTRRRFVGFGTAIGLPPRAVDAAIDEVLGATGDMLEQIAEGALPLDADAQRTLSRRLARRRRDLEP